MIGAGHPDHRVEPGGERRIRRAIVPGCGHRHGSAVPRVGDRGLEGVGATGVRERHEDDVGAVIGGPHDTLDDVGVLTGPVGTEHLDRHHRDVVVADAGDPGAVGGRRGDRGDPGPVPVPVVRGVATGGREAGHEREVGDGRHPGVQHRDRDVIAQRGRSVDPIPADARQRPLRGIGRIIGRRLRVARAIPFGERDARVALVGGERLGDGARIDRDDVETQRRDRRHEGPSARGDRIGDLVIGQAGDRAHDDGGRGRLGGRRVVRSGRGGRGRSVGRILGEGGGKTCRTCGEEP